MRWRVVHQVLASGQDKTCLPQLAGATTHNALERQDWGPAGRPGRHTDLVRPVGGPGRLLGPASCPGLGWLDTAERWIQ